MLRNSFSQNLSRLRSNKPSAISFSISGNVNDGVNPVSGAVVALGSYSATSGSDGNYTISKIPSGTSGTLAVTKTGFASPTISIPAMTQSLTGKNFIESFDYFVHFDNGNDSTGNGTEGNPYKTLTKAQTVASNGKRIGVLGGTNRGSTTISKQLTIKAARSGTPKWNPTTNYTNWSKSVGYTNVYETTYTSLYNYGAWIPGNPPTQLTSVASLALCDSTANSYIFVDASDRLYVNIGGSAPTSIEARDGFSAVCNITNTAGVRIDGLEFDYCSGDVLQMATASTVANCKFKYGQNAVGWEVIIGATNGLISNCQMLLDGKSTAIKVGANITGLTIEDTYIRGANTGVLVSGANSVVNINRCIADTLIFNGFTINNGARGNIDSCKAIDFGHGGFHIDQANSFGIITRSIAYITKDFTGPYPARHGYITETGAHAEYYHCIAANLKRNPSADPLNGWYTLLSGSLSTAKNCATYSCKIGFAADTFSTAVADYNGVYANTQNYSGNWTAGAHDVTSNPLYVDQSTDDYHLQDGSPYINAGIYIAGINDGFLGTAPDIGAFEKA